MKAADQPIIVNAATSQIDRRMAALSDAYAAPDQRSFAQLLDFAVELGRLIVFYDLDDQPDGDWSLFFAADPSFALASMSLVNVDAAERAFDALATKTRSAHLFERKFEGLCQMVEAILDLVRLLDRWMSWPVAGDNAPSAKLLQHKMQSLLRQGLKEALAELLGLGQVAGDNRALGRSVPVSLRGLSVVWSGEGNEIDVRVFRGSSLASRIDGVIDRVVAIFHIFADAVAELAVYAGAELENSIKSSEHAPQAALYIAFARLFAQAQAAIDDFSGRLTRFYYGDVLRQWVRAEQPDHLYLTFTQTSPPPQAVVSVPAGTVFPAGTDADGQDINYCNDKSLGVGAAIVAEVKTVCLTQEPLFLTQGSPPSAATDLVDAQVLATVVALPSQPAPVSWATFGRSQSGSIGIETTAPASLGFAVASATLQMASGERTVSLSLGFNGAALVAVLPALQQLAAQSGLSTGQVFGEILKGGFSLFVSSAGGWLAIDGYSVSSGSASGADVDFTLGFTLPTTAAAVEGTATALPKGAKPPPGVPPGSANPAPDQAVLSAYLVSERITIGTGDTAVEVYPYAILSGLTISTLGLRVAVVGLGPAGLSNPTGTVDASKPFLPFSSPTVVGAALEISQPELFVKCLDHLTVTVSWYGLPQTDRGFFTYYQDYTLGSDGTRQPDLFNNQTFLVDIVVDQPGYWDLPAHAGSPPGWSYYMFRTDAGDPVPQVAAPVLASSEFSDLQPMPAYPPAYYDPANSCLRMVLSAPGYAFGDELYARNVMAAVIADLPDPVRAQQVCKALDGGAGQVLSDAAGVISAASDSLAATNDSGFPAALNAVCGATSGKLVSLVRQALEQALTAVAASGDASTAASLRQSLDEAMAANGTSAGASDGGGLWLGRLTGRFKSDNATSTGNDAVGALSAWLAEHGAALTGTAEPLAQSASNVVQAAQGVQDTHAAAAQASIPAARMLSKSGLTSAAAGLNQESSARLAKCLEQQLSPLAPVQYPNQPWQPVMGSLSLDYEAQSQLPEQNAADVATTFYYLTAFDGFAEVALDGTAVPLLPPPPPAGSLLLGLSGMDVAQPLTLLAQLQSTDAGWSDNSPMVQWRQLWGNGWQALTPQADGTNNFQNTGIIAFSLVQAGDGGSTLLPSGYTWLAASVDADRQSYPPSTAMTTNALQASWVGPGGAQNLGLVPLPAGTIKASDPAVDGIDTIDQPLASFGGRPRLAGETLSPWLGERLRHKNRAVQSWDYARLVLAEFPFVWQCQALPARGANSGATAGSVLVVVVPGPSTPDVADPTVPMATAAQLAEIGTYLQALASPFITLVVSNPVYVRIRVTADVVFVNGGTPQLLNSDLIAYLSPWYYDAARAAQGGGYVSEDSIATYIRQRPYVAAILTISYEYDPDPSMLQWCYMTSALAHDITAADDGDGV